MSYGSYQFKQWSECSRSDFEYHYSYYNWGYSCLDDISGSDKFYTNAHNLTVLRLDILIKFIVLQVWVKHVIVLDTGCKTNGGAIPNRQCTFPFTVYGKTFDACTSVGHTAPWCSTKVDQNGHHVRGNWGDCGSECSCINSRCVFPFIYKGKTYEQCTREDHHEPWCATKVDSNGVLVTGRWGPCVLSSCN